MALRLTLKNGQTLDIRERLKVRDKREIHTYAVDGVAADRQTYRFNVVKHQIATAAARILNWSLLDEAGKAIAWPAAKPFKERIDAVESLDEALFEEVTDLLNAEIEKLEAASVTEKNVTPDGEPVSGSTSPSVS